MAILFISARALFTTIAKEYFRGEPERRNRREEVDTSNAHLHDCHFQAKHLNTHPNETALGMKVIGHEVPEVCFENTGTAVIIRKQVNRGVRWKIWRPLDKNLESEILFFQIPSPSRELDSNLIPRANSPF